MSRIMQLTPKELIGKTYDLKLSNAKDRFGCDAIIVDANSPVRVVSRLDIPEVEFSRAGQKLQVVEGSYVDIPLSIKSKIAVNGNDKIEVKYLGPTPKSLLLDGLNWSALQSDYQTKGLIGCILLKVMVVLVV